MIVCVIQVEYGPVAVSYEQVFEHPIIKLISFIQLGGSYRAVPRSPRIKSLVSVSTCSLPRGGSVTTGI